MDSFPKYALIVGLVPILIRILFSLKNKTTTKALVILLSLIIISSLFPLYPLQGDSNNLQSIFDFIAKSNNTAFAVMLGSYLLSLALLAIPGHKLDKLSLGVYVVGFVSSWVGFFTQVMGPYIVFPSAEFGNTTYLTSLLWLFLYILAPMINLAFFIPLVTSEKSKKQTLQQQIKRQQEVAKIPYRDQLIPLLFMAIVLVIYVVVSTYFYDNYHCPTSQECTIWGSYFSRSAGFYISGFFLFITITIALGKGALKGETKVARYLIPVMLLFFIFGNYASFNTYVKTSEQQVESKDFINGLTGDIKHAAVPWEQIEGFGVNTYKSDGKCKINNLYLSLKDGSKVKLSTSVNHDAKFLEFMVKQKNIPLSSPDC